MFQNRSVVLISLLLVALLAGLILRPMGYLRPVENAFFTVLAPLQYGFSWASNQLAGIVQGVRDIRMLQAQTKELQDTIDRLMIENVRLREAEIELESLRELLHFRLANPTYEVLAAEVIGREPSNFLHYIIVDRGSEDNVAVGMPVVTARGLVGRVTAVYPHSSWVMLLTDPASSVNGLVQSSRATGTVQGQGHQTLVMHYIEQSDQVEKGDVVLTSGLGGTFPKRLVIGQVTSVDRNDAEMFQQVQLESAVRFDRLEAVLIIQNFVPVDYVP